MWLRATTMFARRKSMDDRRFDSLVKALAEGSSRRSVLKGLLGLGGAAVVGSTFLEDDSQAARRPSPTSTPTLKCPGQQTPVNGQCQCVTPKAPGAEKCGPDCCNPGGVGPAHSECCDNACCFGTCYGEELCCPTDAGPGGQRPTHTVCDGVCLDLRVKGVCCNEGDCQGPDLCLEYQCVNGECVATPLVCDDSNDCTNSYCDPELGCVHEAISCDDQNACTSDSCVPGLGCLHIEITCDDGNACTHDYCDRERGCIYEVITCDDNNACTINSCDPERGCIFEPVICDDHNACTVDSCDPESGCHYTPIACDDQNPCTINSCDAELGCVFTQIDCSSFDNPEECLVGVCVNGACTAEYTCPAAGACNGDGTCSAPGGDICTVSPGGACLASIECCGGACCIANLGGFQELLQRCTAAGLPGSVAEVCAQTLLNGYALTCRNPPVIFFEGFPANPVVLPCM